MGAHSLQILDGDAGGWFSAAGRFPVARYTTDGIAHDLDQDGDADLVVLSGGQPGDVAPASAMLTILLNDGSGQFDPRFVETSWPPLTAVTSVLTNLAVVDLNGDRFPDLLTLAGIHFNQGDGTFSAIVPRRLDLNRLASADVDRDGSADLVAVYRDNPLTAPRVGIFRNRGDGSFLEPIAIPVQGSSFVPAPGDFDGDGDPDIALLE